LVWVVSPKDEGEARRCSPELELDADADPDADPACCCCCIAIMSGLELLGSEESEGIVARRDPGSFPSARGD
jgi:hypothetical protein